MLSLRGTFLPPQQPCFILLFTLIRDSQLPFSSYLESTRRSHATLSPSETGRPFEPRRCRTSNCFFASFAHELITTHFDFLVPINLYPSTLAPGNHNPMLSTILKKKHCAVCHQVSLIETYFTGRPRKSTFKTYQPFTTLTGLSNHIFLYLQGTGDNVLVPSKQRLHS